MRAQSKLPFSPGLFISRPPRRHPWRHAAYILKRSRPMGASYELSATVREKVGKGAARCVRRQGLVPAVIYGGKQPPISIHLPDRDVYFQIHRRGFFTTLATIDAVC